MTQSAWTFTSFLGFFSPSFSIGSDDVVIAIASYRHCATFSQTKQTWDTNPCKTCFESLASLLFCVLKLFCVIVLCQLLITLWGGWGREVEFLCSKMGWWNWKQTSCLHVEFSLSSWAVVENLLKSARPLGFILFCVAFLSPFIFTMYLHSLKNI